LGFDLAQHVAQRGTPRRSCLPSGSAGVPSPPLTLQPANARLKPETVRFIEDVERISRSRFRCILGRDRLPMRLEEDRCGDASSLRG
jgi:hypothetical protein